VKIDHYSFSKSGGAGIVASQIQSTQAKFGMDSKITTMLETDLSREPLKYPGLTIASLADRYLVSSPFNDSMISYYRSKRGRNRKHSPRRGSIIHLHWIEGFISNSQINSWLEQGRDVVWTIHDMSPFTGACHHSFDCNQFSEGCKACPQVRRLWQPKISIAQREKIISSSRGNLRVVAPTNWLGLKAKASEIFHEIPISVIPNPISSVFFENYSKLKSRQALGIDQAAIVGVAIANNLQDQGKRIEEIVRVFDSFDSVDGRTPPKLLLIGRNGRQFESFSKSGNIKWLGELSSQELASKAIAADFVCSMSIAESAGMTLRECGALGLPVVAYPGGAAAEMFTPGSSGFLVNSDRDLSDILRKFVFGEIPLEQYGLAMRKDALLSHPDNVFEQYVNLYTNEPISKGIW
jgi:glycosyltransferase involved in cell wall biosynthesis